MPLSAALQPVLSSVFVHDLEKIRRRRRRTILQVRCVMSIHGNGSVVQQWEVREASRNGQCAGMSARGHGRRPERWNIDRCSEIMSSKRRTGLRTT